jgi:hypothetical protein
MEALHREAAEAMTLWTVLFSDMPRLLIEAIRGSVEARVVVSAVENALRQIGTAPVDKPALCGCCSGSLNLGGLSFAVAAPYGVAAPDRVLAFGICEACGVDRESVEAAGVRALKDIWPDTRKLDVLPTGGRA